jgi:hypothetical protein
VYNSEQTLCIYFRLTPGPGARVSGVEVLGIASGVILCLGVTCEGRWKIPGVDYTFYLIFRNRK